MTEPAVGGQETPQAVQVEEKSWEWELGVQLPDRWEEAGVPASRG